MCCSVFTHCAYDTPLCCYALTCPICLYSEIRGKLDGRHCYNHCCVAMAQGGFIDVPLQTGAVCFVYLVGFWFIPYVSVPSTPVLQVAGQLVATRTTPHLPSALAAAQSV